ncbi:MAG: DNA polymerase III subunit chi [Lactobacillaceae bacterium]|jgi:DNA polymerase-3 subunit chi|nr:DNA polymerase III subunit chi [Lactobacillaceae bacterium]
MNRIDFYHLQTQGLDNVLPKLIEKAYNSGKNIKIKVGTEERVEFINSLLWTYSETSFIPHGSKKDGFAELQPIWLSSDDDNPNNAQMLFLVDGAKASLGETLKYERVLNIFDGNDAVSLENARNYWKELKGNAETYYWQQDNSGKWLQK